MKKNGGQELQCFGVERETPSAHLGSPESLSTLQPPSRQLPLGGGVFQQVLGPTCGARIDANRRGANDHSCSGQYDSDRPEIPSSVCD